MPFHQGGTRDPAGPVRRRSGWPTWVHVVLMLAVALVPIAIPIVATGWSPGSEAPSTARPTAGSLPAMPSIATTPGPTAPPPSRPRSSVVDDAPEVAPDRTVAATSAEPDLVVRSVAWTPTRPLEGQLVSLAATVRNIGAAPTPARGYRVGFAIEGRTVTWASVDAIPLAVGAERTHTANGGPIGYAFWFATAGEHTLRVTVDDLNAVPEADDANGILEVAITVA